jgi:hypothetical protein
MSAVSESVASDDQDTQSKKQTQIIAALVAKDSQNDSEGALCRWLASCTLQAKSIVTLCARRIP